MPAPSPLAPTRVASIDAYRGLVMFLMLAEVLRLPRMARAFPDSPFWQFLGYHQSHVEWQGCSLHDLIQPSFSFLVGAALPFSLANRMARGESFGKMFAHAAWRSVLLVLLGVFLRSVGRKETNWTFEDTLSQIGLGYVSLFLLGLARPAWRYVALVVLLGGYWAAFAAYPAPGPDYDFPAVGVPKDWPHHPPGFAAHWDKNSNAAWAFDTWFLNLLPREKPFTHNGGGYATLSFIPTLATMILGLIAGGWLRAGADWRLVGRLAGVGAACLAAGYGLDAAGVCPNVKRIWTPAWTLFSGGWCFLILAGFVAVCDVAGWAGWTFPLRVIGANSIVAYCADHLINGFILASFVTHFGADVFKLKPFGKDYEVYEPLVSGAAVLAVLWLILYWMYRNRIFVRI